MENQLFEDISWKWWFSIAMLVFWGVTLHEPLVDSNSEYPTYLADANGREGFGAVSIDIIPINLCL